MQPDNSHASVRFDVYVLIKQNAVSLKILYSFVGRCHMIRWPKSSPTLNSCKTKTSALFVYFKHNSTVYFSSIASEVLTNVKIGHPFVPLEEAEAFQLHARSMDGVYLEVFVTDQSDNQDQLSTRSVERELTRTFLSSLDSCVILKCQDLRKAT